MENKVSITSCGNLAYGLEDRGFPNGLMLGFTRGLRIDGLMIGDFCHIRVHVRVLYESLLLSSSSPCSSSLREPPVAFYGAKSILLKCVIYPNIVPQCLTLISGQNMLHLREFSTPVILDQARDVGF